MKGGRVPKKCPRRLLARTEKDKARGDVAGLASGEMREHRYANATRY